MIPWFERIPAISINPDMATIEDIARLASELMEARSILIRVSDYRKISSKIHQEIVDFLNGERRQLP